MKKLLALLLLFALTALPACGGSRQPTSAMIDEILSAYKENGARADEMYKDKTLFILGTITEIRSSSVKVTDVGGVTSQFLLAYFDAKSKDLKKVALLDVGDMIAVTGRIKNANFDINHRIGDSYMCLWDCALVPLPKLLRALFVAAHPIGPYR